MATQRQTETHTKLTALINQWATRWRLRRVVLYMPRIVMMTCLVGIITSLVIAYARGVGLSGMLIVTAIAMAMTFVIITSTLGLFSKRGYEAARQFELLFDLQERISTALEIIEGRIKTVPEIAQRQLEDAYEVAQSIDPRKQMPLKVKWLEWAGAFALIGVLIVCIAFSAYLVSQTSTIANAETQGAINNAADTTRDITEDIATDTGLTDEERSALLESAEATLDDLENPELSAEESFVAMSDLESDLREQVEALREELAESEASLEDAADALGNQGNQGNQNEGTEGNQQGENAGEALAQELEEQAQSAESMSEAGQQQLAQELQDAASQVSESNQQLAEDLEQAAESLENNDSQGFQSAMESAAQQSRSTSQQNQTRQESADAMQQAADQAQQAASEIAESEQNQSSQGQNSEQQDGEQQEGQQGEQGQQQGEQQGESEQSGQQQGSGQDPNSQSASEGGAQVESQEGQAPGESSEGQNSEQSGQESGEGEDSGGAGGAGDGDGPDTQGVAAMSDQQIAGNTDNDGGETEFDSIFAPNQIDTQTGDTNIVLETDSSNDQTREGDFSENPNGESTVPYNQVFTNYSDAASDALENGYVPLGVRDVVRDYFTSLEPTGRNSGDE